VSCNDYGIERADSIDCEGFTGWLIYSQILQNDWAMISQSKCGFITIHYERHSPGTGKLETRTDSS